MDLYSSTTWNVLRYTRRENREEFRTPSDMKEEMKCQRSFVCWLAGAAVEVEH